MIEQFGLDISALALDMTNFATYIDTANAKAPTCPSSASDWSSPATAPSLWRRPHRLTLPRVADPDIRIASAYQVFGIPAHFFIDRSGILRSIPDRWPGP